VNANGAMAELPDQIVKILPDNFEIAELVNALQNLRSNPKRRKKNADRAISFMRSHHAPELCAERYHEAIERAYDEVGVADKFVENVRRAGLDNWSAASLADRWDQQRSGGRSRLFIDATYLAKFDARSGIQRVVRSLLKEFFNRDSAIKVEPVYYCSDTNRFRYARRFVSKFLEVDVGGLEDEIADIRFGDFFLGLDLNSSDVGQMSAYLRDLRVSGVHVSFVVYDLLPVRLPDCFVDGAETGHRRWANMVLESDMAICISEAVADDLRAYARETGAETNTEITVFPLGADFHLYPDDRGLLGVGGTEVGETPSFLMVGTLEPRKAHALVLDAFEKLWADGKDVQLCIVGKRGWMVDDVINRIRSLSTTQPRLKWLDNADDQALAHLYRDAVCLIAASRDEGFGLPIIEAAHRGLPVIARDIPVFREVGGNWTSYFPKNASGADLAKHIWAWLEQLRAEDLPKADAPNLVSWKDSADALLGLLERSRPKSQFKIC
jgi:glycosyltransferase involved in cell wall biosynthesis